MRRAPSRDSIAATCSGVSPTTWEPQLAHLVGDVVDEHHGEDPDGAEDVGAPGMWSCLTDGAYRGRARSRLGSSSSACS
jgi:hypothetical protein